MSSEIYYGRAYIRVEDQFIPLANHGSSNCFCFDWRGREVAERYWSVLNFPHRNKFLFTREEMLQVAETFEAINADNRGGIKKSRNISFEVGEFSRWILGGLQRAHTVEEYAQHGYTVQVIDYGDYRGTFCRYPVRTTQELLEMLEKMKEAPNIGVSFADDRRIPNLSSGKRQSKKSSMRSGGNRHGK